MPNVDPRNDEDLDLAWSQIHQILHTGKATRPDKSIVELGPRDYSSLLKWVASMKPIQRRSVTKVEDFLKAPAESGE